MSASIIALQLDRAPAGLRTWRNERTPLASMDTRAASAEDRLGAMALFRFGAFQLDGARRLLLRGAQVVPLVPKALELLELLIQERHRTLSKAELLERLWPSTVVADNNLTVTMSALRKALGESAAQPRYLHTLSRRGYRFVEDAPAVEPGPEQPVLACASSGRLQQLRPVGLEAQEEEAQRSVRPLLGRDTERLHLQRCLERALAGAGRVLFITGEPGIGKTALCESFIAGLAQCELIVLRGRSLEQFGRGEAYLPWLEAWGALLTGPRGTQAQAVLRQVAPSWCREFPALFPQAAEQPAPSITRARLLREMADALGALAAEQPLLVVLEDLHWADAASCDLLRWLSQRSRQQRWLILGTFRGVEAGLLNAPLESLRREALQHDECDELRLGPLAAGHVAACLTAQFQSNDFPDELAHMLYRRTEGHPLFLTRLLSFLVQREDVVQRSGVWVLVRPLERLELEAPEDVRALVRRKLDSLQDEARMTLGYASVEGNEFSSRVLAELLGMDALVLEERLQPLETQHRLIETLGDESWPDGQLSTRYRFAHALYQNELYAGLTSGRRVALHRRTAELLLEYASAETTGAERSRLAATLAVHFERGRALPRAVEFLQLAGHNAHRLCAYAEEERLYTRALELAEQLPDAERAQRVAAALTGLAWALHDGGQSQRAERTMQELRAHARSAGLHEIECEALHGLCAITFLAGRLHESEAFSEEQRRVAVAHGLRRFELQAIACITGTRCAGTCSFSEALRRAEDTFQMIEESGDFHLRAIQHVNFGWANAFQSRFARAEAAYTQGLQFWATLPSPIMMLECLHALGWIQPHLGRFADGLGSFHEAVQLSEQQHIGFHLLRLPDGSGWIRREAGDYAGALAHHRAGINRAQANGARFLELCLAIELGCDFVALGELAQAGEALARAQRLLDGGELAVFPCYVQRAQLRLRAAQARRALALADWSGARSAAESLLQLAALDPAHEFQVRAHEVLARAALAEGELEQAQRSSNAAQLLLEQFPSALLSWRSHALASEIHAKLGARQPARAAAAQARSVIAQLGSDLRAVALEQTFLDSAPVRGALALAL